MPSKIRVSKRANDRGGPVRRGPRRSRLLQNGLLSRWQSLLRKGSTMRRMILAAPVLALALAACSESSDAPVAPGAAALPADSRKDPEAGAAVYWNEVARGLVVKYTFNP